jgi:nucleotide-binding universal stress UspA family protein
LIPSHGDAETKLIDDAQRMLDALGSRIAEDTRMAAVSRIAIGAVLDEILSAAEQADLLVLGAHGSNRWREMFLGTTADRLLRMCTRPVLVIKRPPETSYRRALVPVDFSPHSIAALNTAMRVAPNADIMVVHASAVPFEGMLRQGGVLDDEIERFRGQAQQEAMSRISSLIDEVAEGSRRLFRFVELEDAARLILAKEESFGADLIVMGKHGKNVVEEMLLGSVTRRILSDSKCDVLIVHEGSTATGSPAA